MSHTNFLYHIVCGTSERRPLISSEWEKRLFAYLGKTVRNFKGIPIEINGIEDHLHLLVRLTATIRFSDFMRELKAESSKFVRREITRDFGWQRRYGAFTVSESAFEDVRRYIRNQKIHHTKMDFAEEYKAILTLNKIPFEEAYLWE